MNEELREQDMKAGMDVRSLRWAVAWMCVTFTRGLDPEEVFARYGAEPSQARLLDWDTASELVEGDSGDGTLSLLRAGRLGDWAFCVEEEGGIGFDEETLAKLSRGTETYSVATTEGLDVFQYWRNGECVEYFEPGMEHTRSEQNSLWWDRMQEALAAHEGGGAGMAPAVALVLNHLGITLDDTVLAGPWPSLTLAEDDAPSASPEHTWTNEGAIPPGTVEVL
ncbi:DUF6461 domain-containing protein [Streptomyces sp. NPDC087300]|uniref:DUF6461 domain-containing protein n=1 Tax=Streptomyces sp. NPDC087300 TaxID=3365780 RepID=UPI003809C3BC